METNDIYMTISHYHNNPERITTKRMLLLNIKCIIYSLGDNIDYILFDDDINHHKEQMRLLKMI